MSKRYFVNNVDTQFGQAFRNELVKEAPQTPVHICTSRYGMAEKPMGFKKILKRQKPKLSRKKMLQECDVYIYDVFETDYSDIEFVSSIFSKLSPDQQKVLILVSNIATWGNSPPKIKVKEEAVPQDPASDQPKAEDQPKDEQDQEIPQQTVKQLDDKQKAAQVQQKPEYTYYVESDYKSRVALEGHKRLKEMQDMVLSAKRDGLKVIVICGGVRYGLGQNIFYNLFKSAWLQDTPELHYLQSGENLLPTIHIVDLVKFVIKIAEAPPQDINYLLAFDKAQDRRQIALISSIARQVGNNKVKSVKSSPILKDEDIIRLHVWAAPSKLLVGSAQEPVQFQWTCPLGIQGNCPTVLQQFWKKQNLRPIKIIMSCQESQKQATQYKALLQSIKKHYRIPSLNIQTILAEAAKEPSLGQDLAQEMSSIKEYLKSGKSRPLDQTMKVYYRAIKWRLNQNDCKNRGFILDCFPNLSEEADLIFTPQGKKLNKKKKKIVPKPVQPVLKTQKDIDDPQGQEQPPAQPVVEPEAPAQQPEPQPQAEQQQGQKPKFQSFFPQSVITLKNFKLKRENQQMLNKYFSQKGVQTYLSDSSNRDHYQAFQSLRIYIQRNGCPNNYLIQKEQLFEQFHKHYKAIDQKNHKAIQKQLQADKSKKVQILSQRQKVAEQQLEYILNNQAELELTKNIPFRNYLMEFVVPILNQGLLEVSNIIPDDPVELLAEFLFRKSNEV